MKFTYMPGKQFRFDKNKNITCHIYGERRIKIKNLVFFDFYKDKEKLGETITLSAWWFELKNEKKLKKKMNQVLEEAKPRLIEAGLGEELIVF